ncbi:Protein YIPF1 [Choanephora cucurbitarum]|uniref:Protein YIP n=1 Tax=Choanephora cucurbitarum TaxID=101091 RepID=A0A1C7MZX8_9FUNG|nr:Protein YIPF1 [Choanephora cucurbitarum]
MSNKYNVLVDMEDTAYSQPATIESDGLEFQDFSNSQHLNTSAYNTPLPSTANTATANLGGSSNHLFDTNNRTTNATGKPVWSVEYYAQFFDVDTSQVMERCLKSMYPVGDFAQDTLNHQPDLYGPFWIATSVVFAVFVCSSLAGSLAAYMSGQPHVYDFTLLSFAVVVVYLYAFLCPALVWASTKYFGCQPSLLDIINYYGYGLTIWIPVSLLCIMPFDYARWAFVGTAFLITAVFLVKNLYIVISRTDAKTSRIILIAILLAHTIFALVLKMAFYSYEVTLQPVTDQPS